MAEVARNDDLAQASSRDKAALFVSYAREEQEIVKRLAAALRADGRDVWIDTDAIRGTDEWARAVDAGIESSDAVAFVLSPAFVESDQCSRELEHAVRNGKRLVPLLAREVDPAGVAPELARLKLDSRRRRRAVWRPRARGGARHRPHLGAGAHRPARARGRVGGS